jgi:hypothetical protein
VLAAGLALAAGLGELGEGEGVAEADVEGVGFCDCNMLQPLTVNPQLQIIPSINKAVLQLTTVSL